MHNEELLVPDENDDPREISELGRLADFISGKVPENEFRNFGAASIQITLNTPVSTPHSQHKPFSN